MHSNGQHQIDGFEWLLAVKLTREQCRRRYGRRYGRTVPESCGTVIAQLQLGTSLIEFSSAAFVSILLEC